MLKSILISTLIFQMVLLPLASSDPNVPKTTDPTKVEEPDTGFWKNSRAGNDDPWNIDPGTPGTSTPGWINSGPITGWEDPSTSIGASWNNSQPMFSNTSMGQLDDPTVWWIKTSEILSQPYEKVVLDLIKNNPGKNLDELADIVIQNGKNSAAKWGIYVSTMYFVVSFLVTKVTSSQGSIWSTTANVATAAAGAIWEFAEVFKAQASMILTLDTLYGGIGDNAQSRLNRINTSFSFFALASGLQNLSVQKLSGFITAKLLATAGATAAQTAAGATAAAIAPVIAGASQTAVAPILNAAGNQILTAAAAKETGTVAIKDGSGIVTQASKNELLNKLALRFSRLSEGSQKIVVGAVASFITAIVAVGINYFSTDYLGHILKVQFQRELADREAMGLAYINQNSEAKHALWLILTRDVFNRMVPTKKVEEQTKIVKVQEGKVVSEHVEPKVTKILGYYKPNFPIAEQERYAKVVAQMLPLFNSDNFGSEFEELSKDFKENPKMIDNYLNNLRDSLNVEAKIWFMKILISGMYVKGRLNDGDITTLHTVARLLALEPPPGKTPAPNDVRNIQIMKYKLMVMQIEKAITEKQMILAGLSPKKNSLNAREKSVLENLEKRGASGQALYEEFLNIGKATSKLARLTLDRNASNEEISQALKDAIGEQTDKMSEDLKKEKSLWEKAKNAIGF